MRNLPKHAISLTITAVSLILVGCATLPPSATESRSTDFPVKVQSQPGQSNIEVMLSDTRPIEQRSFQEKPTATGRYAILGDGAIAPEPAQLIRDAIASVTAPRKTPIQAELKTFRIEVVFRTSELGCSPGASVTPVLSGGGRLLFVPSGYLSCGTWQDTMSSIDVKVHVVVEGKDHTSDISVPFERRLEPTDVANTVTQAIDRLRRSISN